MYDIAVIGLGPAGANFARLIDADKYRVAAIDRKSEDRDWTKPCGGLLAPDAQKELASLNLPPPGEVLVSPQIFYVRTLDFDNGLERNYQRFYINIDRRKFDEWLVSLIPENVDIYAGTVVAGVERKKDFFEISVKRGGQDEIIRARRIVGADGANSAVAKSLLKTKKRNLRLSIQEWYKKDGSVPFFFVHIRQ